MGNLTINFLLQCMFEALKPIMFVPTSYIRYMIVYVLICLLFLFLFVIWVRQVQDQVREVFDNNAL